MTIELEIKNTIGLHHTSTYCILYFKLNEIDVGQDMKQTYYILYFKLNGIDVGRGMTQPMAQNNTP
jgi:hypothetical protein